MSESESQGTHPSTPTEIVGTINVPILARITDDLRASIINYRPPGPWPHLKEVTGIISAFLADEETPRAHASIDTIRACRLDRLLDDILDPDHHPKNGEGGETFLNLEKNAFKLQRIWKAKFREVYEDLDEVRCKAMMVSGRLQEPGMWFLNMACVKRRGVEGESLDDLSINGTRVVPLLWGKEETLSSDLVKYTREGSARDMVYSLLTHVGRTSHVLRGYKLRGPFSPEVGIRYDGLYNLRSFALKRDPATGIYRMTLTGERSQDQTPMQKIRAVPRPSEIDDWHLCSLLEERAMREAGRGSEFAHWKRNEKGGSIEF